MSTAPPGLPSAHPHGPEARYVGPPQGWTAVALLGLAVAVVAWAVDDAAWLFGRGELTDFVLWAALGGYASGLAGVLLGSRRWPGHLLGAAAAALVVPVLVGRTLTPPGTDAGLAAAYERAATSAAEAVFDLTIRGLPLTNQLGHAMLVLGLLLWGTGQFVASAAFRGRRPHTALIVLGTVLLVNVALTPRDQLAPLVLFTAVGLLFLVRWHAADERRGLRRSGIGDPAALVGRQVRAGTLFVGGATAAALVLSAIASSAPLAGAWTGAESWLIEAGRGLQRYVPFVQSIRGPTVVDFGPSAPITGRWVTDSVIALTVEVPAGDGRRYYWRAATYDQFIGNGWNQTVAERRAVVANGSLLEGSLDAPPATGQVAVSVVVRPAAYRGRNLLAPGSPSAVNRPSVVELTDGGGGVANVELDRGGVPYTVEGLVPAIGDDRPGGLTANRLRAAGQVYPTEITRRYLQVPPGAIGPEGQALLERARSSLRVDTPYDLAAALVEVLHGPDFTYDTDVTDLDCGNRSIVECFATFRRGYCQYYATTMAILLRAAGIPTRLVQGFLPGDRSPSGIETIRNSAAHAWVEVYFPGYGWVDFDPTGGNLSQLPQLPAGRPVPLPSVGPRPSIPTDEGPEAPRRSPPGSAGAGTTLPPPAAGPDLTSVGIALGVVLLAGLLLVGLARRVPRQLDAETAWRTITRLAARFGAAPRPSQTVYEYSAALAELVPAARPELETVARAKVEVTYGRRVLGADRLAALGWATDRLRVRLVGLLVRGLLVRRRRRASLAGSGGSGPGRRAG